MNRTRIIEHYKKFHGILEIVENEQINIDWAESLIIDLCNGLPLHEKRKCDNCGKTFSTANSLQKCCNDNCRIQLHRAKHRMKVFVKRVEKILKSKNANAKFIVEQIITDSGKCPFIVHFEGREYKSDSTKSLLNQLKNEGGYKCCPKCGEKLTRNTVCYNPFCDGYQRSGE